MLAAKEGGANPDGNFRLRLAIDRARSVNMPRENIQRAIERATAGGDANALESIVYEGYGPGGGSVMVEALEDLDDVQRVHANFDVPDEVLQHA